MSVHANDKTHTGTVSILAMNEAEQAWADGRPMRTFCAVPDCSWEHEGTAKECRDLALAHRTETHPKLANRKRRARSSTTERLLRAGAAAREAPDRVPSFRPRGYWADPVNVIEGLHRFRDDLGHIPTSTQAQWRHYGRYPSYHACVKLFGSWQATIAAAFPADAPDAPERAVAAPAVPLAPLVAVALSPRLMASLPPVSPVPPVPTVPPDIPLPTVEPPALARPGWAAMLSPRLTAALAEVLVALAEELRMAHPEGGPRGRRTDVGEPEDGTAE